MVSSYGCKQTAIWRAAEFSPFFVSFWWGRRSPRRERTRDCPEEHKRLQAKSGEIWENQSRTLTETCAKPNGALVNLKVNVTTNKQMSGSLSRQERDILARNKQGTDAPKRVELVPWFPQSRPSVAFPFLRFFLPSSAELGGFHPCPSSTSSKLVLQNAVTAVRSSFLSGYSNHL